ncbi:hypothetical protein [Roseovarius mucosus]|uniref:hypothetical protein n=1 Tax=Roseovarius mucosus TaxID=215743 RepID=UPI000A63DEBC|nr:hypothetical protein [Roseovarius mucosus]
MHRATLVFSAQDALSRHLTESYNFWMIVMVRYITEAGSTLCKGRVWMLVTG